MAKGEREAITAAVLAALLSGSTAAPVRPSNSKEAAVSVEAEERAVRAALAAFIAAVNRQDFAAVVEMVTDDAVFWTADYPALEGRDAVRAAYAGLAAYRVHQEFRLEELHVSGDWAFARGYEDFTLEPKDGKGERLEMKGRRAISILRRQSDGSWKTARGMTNFDTPNRAAPGASRQ